MLMRLFHVPHNVAAPGALIGASNFFELAVAVAHGQRYRIGGGAVAARCPAAARSALSGNLAVFFANGAAHVFFCVVIAFTVHLSSSGVRVVVQTIR